MNRWPKMFYHYNWQWVLNANFTNLFCFFLSSDCLFVSSCHYSFYNGHLYSSIPPAALVYLLMCIFIIYCTVDFIQLNQLRIWQHSREYRNREREKVPKLMSWKSAKFQNSINETKTIDRSINDEHSMSSIHTQHTKAFRIHFMCAVIRRKTQRQ